MFWGSLLSLGGLLYLKVWLPATHLSVPCVFREATGFLCPGCGVTRFTLALLRGEVEQAFRYNPLIFALVPMYALYALALKRKQPRAGSVMMAGMLTLTILFGVMRNIPLFDWLAPTVLP